jgi:hypothetical protein
LQSYQVLAFIGVMKNSTFAIYQVLFFIGVMKNSTFAILSSFGLHRRYEGQFICNLIKFWPLSKVNRQSGAFVTRFIEYIHIDQ